MYRYLPTSDEMYAAEHATMNTLKIPQSVLMERAAFFAYEVLLESVLQKMTAPARVLILCGNGNNGGDGFALARILLTEGHKVTCILPPSDKRSDGCREQEERLMLYRDKAGFEEVELLKELPSLQGFDVIVDAIFGIGLSRPIEGFWKGVIPQVNEAAAFRLAIDIPSGLMADTGEIPGVCFHADATAAIGAVKLGELIGSGPEVCGEIYEDPIGIVCKDALNTEPLHYGFEDSRTDYKSFLPRDPRGNKGTFGKVLLYAGSASAAGACIMAAKAAFASGCGMVKILTDQVNRDLILHEVPEAMVDTVLIPEILADHPVEEEIKAMVSWADVVAMGPGIGNDAKSHKVMQSILGTGLNVPLLLDADGLNVLSTDPLLYAILPKQVIMTPHMGEAARLLDLSVSQLAGDGLFRREYALREYLGSDRLCDLDVCIALKDHATIVCSSHEDRIYVNLSGDDGMATAGSGDVLTGLLAGILAQSRNSQHSMQEKVSFAVYLHGLCGEIAATEKNSYSMTASDEICALWELLS
ncbi:MAG: NAD(P)H-hydrate dehydratase [Lachnospiraceae bacterium]|nr:NAD(P)H-hydrate dehydratase [Lachnospiraceae bacterium]